MTGNSRRIPIHGRPAAAARASGAASGGRPGGPDPVSAPSAPGTKAEPRSTTPPESIVSEDAVREAEDAVQAQLQAELEALRRERDVLAERELRLRAEFENFRKRATRDAMEARERGQSDLISELLPVVDNLERALDAAEHHDEGKVLGGVRMTRDMFVALLRRAGVEEIETVGQPFDPHVHEAVVMQPSDEDEGVVTAVLQRGYRQGDRIVRPARVVVSSGKAHTAGQA